MGTLKIKEKKHKKVTLATVVGTDMLTAREKLVKNEIGGFYAISNELAYCAGNDDKDYMSVPEFEKYLRDKIDPHFSVIFNPTITAKHEVIGHSIYFYLPAWDSFIPVCKVGRSADNIIPANSQAKIVEYKGHSYKGYGILDEQAILYRGWVAAYEACKLAYADWELNGIEPSKALSAKEILALKQIYKLNIGGKAEIEQFVEKAAKDKLVNEIAFQEQNLVYFKDDNMLKYRGIKDTDKFLFMTKEEYKEKTLDEIKELELTWAELTPEEIQIEVDRILNTVKECNKELEDKETEETKE